MSKYVITGPESSGKTYTALHLAKLTKMHLVEEVARIQLEEEGPSYTYDTIETIARRHIAIENGLDKMGEATSIILDTDLLTLYIWSIDKYNKVSSYILDNLSRYTDDRHYLLCKPDIKWEYDPLRENKDDRDRLFDIYLHELRTRDLPFTIISGTYAERDIVIERISRAMC